MPYKLLLADDSVTIQRVIELTFADEDITVVAVGDGQQAVDRIEADPPDIILADIGMPKRNGYDVAGYVKSRPKFAHIPVLLLTGAFEPLDRARATAVGCDGVLAKPFEPQVVINRVKELLRGTAAPAVHAAPAVAAPRVFEPAAVATGLRVADTAPSPSHSPTEPASEFMMDTMRPVAPASDPNASLDDYFDQLDAAFSKLGGPQSPKEAVVEVPSIEVPSKQDSSLDFDWAPKPNSATMPIPMEESTPGLRRTGVSEFEWTTPAQDAGSFSSSSLDFAGVAGIEVSARPSAAGIDELVRPSNLAAAPPRREEVSAPPAAQAIAPPVAPRAPRVVVAAPLAAKVTAPPVAPQAPKVAVAAPLPSPAPIADVFAALLAAEQGEASAPRATAAARPAPAAVAMPSAAPSTAAPRSVPAPAVPAPAVPAPVAVTEAVIEQIAERVLQRLSDKVVRDTVTEVVSRVAEMMVRDAVTEVVSRVADSMVRDTVTEMVPRVAERMVREEIERIKGETM